MLIMKPGPEKSLIIIFSKISNWQSIQINSFLTLDNCMELQLKDIKSKYGRKTTY